MTVNDAIHRLQVARHESDKALQSAGEIREYLEIINGAVEGAAEALGLSRMPARSQVMEAERLTADLITTFKSLHAQVDYNITQLLTA